MIKNHKTTADMVKRFLNVIETRVEKTKQSASEHSSRMESSLERTSI